jgi:hypothetical protein
MKHNDASAHDVMLSFSSHNTRGVTHAVFSDEVVRGPRVEQGVEDKTAHGRADLHGGRGANASYAMEGDEQCFFLWIRLRAVVLIFGVI